MDDELKELKEVLRSLVVSSPTQVDVRSLMRDYRSMVGKTIPLAKYGYKEPVQFLKERFNDCFLFQGQALNPVLTLIVPDTLKHIDKFVQNQKVSSTLKHKGKRRSIPMIEPSPSRNLICKSFIQKQNGTNNSNNKHKLTEQNAGKPNKVTKDDICSINSLNINGDNTSNVKETNDVKHNEYGRTEALETFLKRRIPFYNNLPHLESETNNEEDYSKEDTDSGRQTSSSHGSAKWNQLEEMKMEIRNLIGEHAEGVWCTELIALYRERYGRELNFSRFGYTSVLSLACVLEDELVIWRPDGSSDWKLLTHSPDMHPAPRSLPPLRQLSSVTFQSRDTVNPDDALPGIDFEADVFPEDCMHYLDSIPQAELPAESSIEVQVGELYSPSHLWLIRLGEAYNIAMEDLMDEMNEYYVRGEGKDRTLARGAVRVGHYCSCCYGGDWHRSLIVRILDSDTVKVRHVDYGTVDRISVNDLRPLLRRWSSLPQQAIRARMAGVRPPAAGRRWPRSSAAHLLRRLTDKRLVAQIVSRSAEAVLEVLLVDTSTDEDVCINTELVRSGHADSRPDSCLGTSECYLYPTFAALETADTPNYAELHSYLRDGIDLEYVEEFRRHVPPCLPSPPNSPDLSTPFTPNFRSLEYPTSSNRPLSSLEHPEFTSRLYSPLEYPECPLLVTNRLPLFPLDTETLPSPTPSYLHDRRTPLYSQPPEFTNPNPANPATDNPDTLTKISTNKIPNNQKPPTTVPISSISDPPPTPRPQHTPPNANETLSSATQFQHGVTLSAADCEFFCLLSRVDPNAAQRFMMEALGRAIKPPLPIPLNPKKKEFSMVAAETQTEQPVHATLIEPSNDYTPPSLNSTQTQTIHPSNGSQLDGSRNGCPPLPVQTQPLIRYNGHMSPPINPTQLKHTHPVYNNPKPNTVFNKYTSHPQMPGQMKHHVCNDTSYAHKTVRRFLQNARTMPLELGKVRPPPGFENC